MNGYQIIQDIVERSGGVWKPSPGSIYPTLQQLEDEGLVRLDEDAGRRTYRLTDEGRQYVTDHAEQTAAPWQSMSAAADDDVIGIRALIGQIASALWQIRATASAEQQARAREVLTNARRQLYGILAEGDDDDDGGRGGGDD
jgi:DNA-binding PadR family transcriptional regulator